MRACPYVLDYLWWLFRVWHAFKNLCRCRDCLHVLRLRAVITKSYLFPISLLSLAHEWALNIQKWVSFNILPLSVSKFQYRNNSISNTSLSPTCLQLMCCPLAHFFMINIALLPHGNYFYTKHITFEMISKHLEGKRNFPSSSYLLYLPVSSLQLVREKQPNS